MTERERERDGQTRTERIFSLSVSACLSQMLACIRGIRDRLFFPLHTHAWHTHANNDALHRAQTSVTSLPPEFNRNQLRLSKKGETYPPPLCPSSDFISAFLQLFIPLLFLLLPHCHDFISPPLSFQHISICTFSFFTRQIGDRHAVISPS